MNKLNLYINDQLTFKYDRSTQLDDKQQAFLDNMDKGMDSGFRIHGEMIAKPDVKQKATFVTMNLLKALQQEDEARILVSCAYLVSRLPHVVEVHARDQEDHIMIEFVEEH
jgi:hypothetical protein